LFQNACVFKGDVADATSDSLQIVGDMPVIDEAVLARKVSSHRRHDNPILQFQISDMKRTEEGLETSHDEVRKGLIELTCLVKNGIQYCMKANGILNQGEARCQA